MDSAAAEQVRGERWIRNAPDLSAFRSTELSAAKVYQALDASSGRVLFNADTGVGKTRLLRDLVAEHRSNPKYDLLIYMTSQKRVLLEQPWVQEALASDDAAINDVAIVLGRPAERCGDLDADWKVYEKAGCGQLGRSDLCGGCPRRRGCRWPDQISVDNLRGRRVIGTVQSYVTAMPDFVDRMLAKTGGQTALVLIDEATILDSQAQHHVTFTALRKSLETFRRVSARDEVTRFLLAPWISAHERLLAATSEGKIVGLARLGSKIGPAIERVGFEQYGASYRFLGYELWVLAASPWWPSEDGSGITYISRPRLHGVDYFIAAAGVPLDLARHRLDEPQLQEFCPGQRFLCDGTAVYNLNCNLGAARNWHRNAPQIVFAMAQLVANLHGQGRRAIVVVRKKFTGDAARILERDLRDLTGMPWRVIANASTSEISDPLVVPLITYGSMGINTYEGFDAALALSSYNARDDVIADMLNDVHRPREEVQLTRINHEGRRTMQSTTYWQRRQGFDDLAESYTYQLESAVAEQAIGRVRFAVSPRLVVFFQTGPLRYPAHEFHNLDAFRSHFGLVTRREWERRHIEREVVRLHRLGMKPEAIAQATGASRRSVYRHIENGRATNPVEDSLPETSWHSGRPPEEAETAST